MAQTLAEIQNERDVKLPFSESRQNRAVAESEPRWHDSRAVPAPRVAGSGTARAPGSAASPPLPILRKHASSLTNIFHQTTERREGLRMFGCNDFMETQLCQRGSKSQLVRFSTWANTCLSAHAGQQSVEGGCCNPVSPIVEATSREALRGGVTRA